MLEYPNSRWKRKVNWLKTGQEGLPITHLVRNANALNGIKAQSFDIEMSLMDVEDHTGIMENFNVDFTLF